MGARVKEVAVIVSPSGEDRERRWKSRREARVMPVGYWVTMQRVGALSHTARNAHRHSSILRHRHHHHHHQHQPGALGACPPNAKLSPKNLLNMLVPDFVPVLVQWFECRINNTRRFMGGLLNFLAGGHPPRPLHTVSNITDSPPI